MDFIINWYYIC